MKRTVEMSRLGDAVLSVPTGLALLLYHSAHHNSSSRVCHSSLKYRSGSWLVRISGGKCGTSFR